jgi:hypothetical protein
VPSTLPGTPGRVLPGRAWTTESGHEQMEAQIICGLNMRCAYNNETRTSCIGELCRIMDFSFPIADKEPRYALASVGQVRLTDCRYEELNGVVPTNRLPCRYMLSH